MTTQRDLSIAIVGTTSSGKSTLLNLLCGRFLLTPKVQESPRVRVELRHRSWPNCITVYDPFAPHLGVVRTHSDAAGRQALQEIIQRMARLPEADRLSTPIPVELPILLASPEVNSPNWWKGLAGRLRRSRKPRPRFPVGYRVVLRDLPGYLESGNQELRGIISAGLSNSSVVFLFNAGEVDHRKEEELIRLVFQQLRKQGQSWSQVFFALNRIDVFGRDRGQRDEKRNRIASLQARLTSSVQEEYGLPQRPEPPAIHQIATLPALASQLLSRSNGHIDHQDRNYLIDTAIDYATRMVPRSIAEKLPRSRERWTASDVRTFCRHTASASHWKTFRRAICQHVHRLSPPLLPTIAMKSTTLTESAQEVKACALTLWRFESFPRRIGFVQPRLCHRIEPGQRLRVEVPAPAVLCWTADNRKSIQESPTWETGLGTFQLDLPTEYLPAGSQVEFTIFWPETGRWEGRYFFVDIGAT